MASLSDLERPAESDYLNCIRCGLWLAVCPTYRESLKESASPRGRVALARKGMEGQLEIIEATLAVVGSLSVGLGVGMLKRPYLEDALGPISIDIQRRIKQTLDPLNILNPGEFFMA